MAKDLTAEDVKKKMQGLTEQIAVMQSKAAAEQSALTLTKQRGQELVGALEALREILAEMEQ